jgi:hypothetical protein
MTAGRPIATPSSAVWRRQRRDSRRDSRVSLNAAAPMSHLRLIRCLALTLADTLTESRPGDRARPSPSLVMVVPFRSGGGMLSVSRVPAACPVAAAPPEGVARAGAWGLAARSAVSLLVLAT